MIKKILILSVFLVNYLFSFQLLSNDYMSIELQKAIDLECKKSVKNNLFDTKEECRYSIIESLNKVGIVSVTRINDQEIQKEIEEICVFSKKRSALDYNKCIHKQVYAYLGLEIIEIPLVINDPIEKEEVKETEFEMIKEDDGTDVLVKTEISPKINDEEIFELDSDKVITEINPLLPITSPKEIVMPEDLLRLISETAIPSTYYVMTWKKKPDENAKIKYEAAGTGSAVAISKNLLATACHVVTDYFFNEDKNNWEQKFLITNVIHVNDNVSDQTKWLRRLELFAEDFESDRCIIKHEELNAVPAKTRNYEDLKEFEKVYAVGNPRGYLGKTAEGTITRLYDFVPPIPSLMRDFKTSEIELIETNAPIDKGNSGGGLFDTSGNLIGIAAQCEILGGPEICYDEYGITLQPEDRNKQCRLYCNKTQPQNWFIPISRYPELTTDEIF